MPVIGYLRQQTRAGPVAAFRQGLSETAMSKAERGDRISLGGGPIRSIADICSRSGSSPVTVIARTALLGVGGKGDYDIPIVFLSAPIRSSLDLSPA